MKFAYGVASSRQAWEGHQVRYWAAGTPPQDSKPQHQRLKSVSSSLLWEAWWPQNTTVDTSEVILCLYNLFVHIMEIHDMSRSTPIWTTHRIDLNNGVPHAMIIAHTMSFMSTFKGYEHSS